MSVELRRRFDVFEKEGHDEKREEKYKYTYYGKNTNNRGSEETMTVIAWDGKTLATDRIANRWLSEMGVIKGLVWHEQGERSSNHYRCWTSTLHQTTIGMVSAGMPDIKPDVPPSQAKLIVVKKDGLYELSCKMLIPNTAPYSAFGDGKEIALGALAMGATANQAVNICNEHSLQCGKGVEFKFTLRR